MAAARMTALEKLDEGRQALMIATGWLRAKLEPSRIGIVVARASSSRRYDLIVADPSDLVPVGHEAAAMKRWRGSNSADQRRREHGPDRDTPHGDRGRGQLAVAGVRYTAVSTHPSTPAEVWERRHLTTTGPRFVDGQLGAWPPT